MAQDETWTVASVVAVPRESASKKNELLFWIGLRNNSGVARLLCVKQYSYSFSTASTARQTGGGQGGPHACASEEAYGLVPPGETRYVFLRAEVLQEGLDAGAVEIQLSLAEGRIGTAVDGKAMRLLSWKGSVQNALNAGAALR
jgi:hypothetical protein